MDSPTDLFEDSTSHMSLFGSASCTDPPGRLQSEGARPFPALRPPPYPLIQHLLQPGAAPKRPGGQLQLNAHHRQNLGRHRYLDNRLEEEDEEEGDGREERGVEEEEGLLEGKNRSGGVSLVAEWSRDVLRVKRMKLEGVVARRDGEAEGGGRRERGGGVGREARRREREELKEQLEEARERLQALQERVWRAFGEKHTEEEDEKRDEDAGAARGGEGGGGTVDEDEDAAEGMFDDEDDAEGVGDMDSLSVSVFPNPSFQNFHHDQQEKRGDRERGEGLFLEGLIERAGVWLGCGGLVRGAWDGAAEGEEEEGGQKFAQALKLELGSAVARVIDRVLHMYTETPDLPPPPPPSVSILPSESANGRGRGGGGGGVWMGLMRDGGDERKRGREERGGGGQDGEREKRQAAQTNGGVLPGSQMRHREHPADALPLVIQRLQDKQRANPLLGPPLPSHPGLSLHHPSLPRHPPPPHPSLLPPPSRPKDSFLSSASSFPPPPPHPLPLPLLHYSMQQLFSRSLPHLARLPPSHKDYLNSDPFLEFPPHHPSSHPFHPVPLLGHLDPSLAAHHSDREREGGMRGGGGGMDGGEMYLQAGGSQEGLSPCHLKKAKLMFFYARYPSSNTLKTYFPDVKFNRCVTSQLIKWFSNFREFFYIQMERFARQAVREALTRDAAPRLGRESQLHMGRDTELYRILNMHYNKSNVYQVPERFIEVAEVTLREFYTAIQTGRDSDPCWKKGIYKIVCKLDSAVPDSFRLPGCPVG